MYMLCLQIIQSDLYRIILTRYGRDSMGYYVWGKWTTLGSTIRGARKFFIIFDKLLKYE